MDENGRVLDVKTDGTPNPDVGMCICVALRDMRVRKDVIDEAKDRLRQSFSSLANPLIKLDVNMEFFHTGGMVETRRR